MLRLTPFLALTLSLACADTETGGTDTSTSAATEAMPTTGDSTSTSTGEGSTTAGESTTGEGSTSTGESTGESTGSESTTGEGTTTGDSTTTGAAAQEVIIHYHNAEFTNRHNWVDSCNFGDQGYAFTAYHSDHLATDCQGLYAPDGTRQGTAIFTFPDLPAATYEIGVSSFHSLNRNPLGALVLVDGEGKRIMQHDELGIVEDIWGTKELEGTIEVVIDSAVDGGSDSVITVRLTPL